MASARRRVSMLRVPPIGFHDGEKPFGHPIGEPCSPGAKCVSFFRVRFRVNAGLANGMPAFHWRKDKKNWCGSEGLYRLRQNRAMDLLESEKAATLRRRRKRQVGTSESSKPRAEETAPYAIPLLSERLRDRAYRVRGGSVPLPRFGDAVRPR